jgi:hypothetical protein
MTFPTALAIALAAWFALSCVAGLIWSLIARGLKRRRLDGPRARVTLVDEWRIAVAEWRRREAGPRCWAFPGGSRPAVSSPARVFVMPSPGHSASVEDSREAVKAGDGWDWPGQ